MTPGLLFRDVELSGTTRADVRVAQGHVIEIGTALEQRQEQVIQGDGGALIPGLADHHLHLAATAAATSSTDLTSLSADQAADAIATSAPDPAGWVRVIGFDEQAHGDLDRHRLDVLRGDVPLRVQHRGGSLWVLNSAALARLDPDTNPETNPETDPHPGIERGDDGVPTGRLWRADDWIGTRLGDAVAPSLADLGRRLAALGITHVSDASPDARPAAFAAAAVASGELPQTVMVMAADVRPEPHPRLSVGPAKIVVADHATPDLEELAARIRALHASGRPVAVHCVTRVALVLTLAALDLAGTRPGDRIEHCAVADDDLALEIARRDLAVVTQPSLLRDRGDDYWARSDPADRPHLWPYARLLRAGVRVSPSSDAPYGDLDPWSTIAAAVARRTPSGRVLGATDVVPAATALNGFLAPPTNPGGPPRVIAIGAPADLVLLGSPLADVLATPSRRHVRATFVAGEQIYG